MSLNERALSRQEQNGNKKALFQVRASSHCDFVNKQQTFAALDDATASCQKDVCVG